MAREIPSERELYRQALAPGKDCPPINNLDRLLEPNAPRDLALHVASCCYCRTELELLRVFQAAPRSEAEAEAVQAITAKLQARLPQIVPVPAAGSEPWWRRLFQAPWLSPAAMAMAGVLIAVAAGVEWRHSGAPEIHAPNPPEQAVLRSGTFHVMFPAGDIREVPREIRWQPVAGAAQYELRLLEVDRHELWKATASKPQADLPPQVQALIVPAKTLLWEVVALDGTGRKLAESEPARFRLLQNVYTR